MYFTVYDPNGEMFEVQAHRLNDLVVVRGWTFWHPSEKKEVFKEVDTTQTHEGTSE